MYRTTARIAVFLLLSALSLTIVPPMSPGVGHHAPTWDGATRAARAQPMPFLEAWDGRPPSPLAWQPANWDVQIHQVDRGSWKQFEPLLASHGADCAAPPATHQVTTHEQAVFLCNGHMMTAIQAGYGLIYLTPNQEIDFTTGEAVLRFDLSTLRTSSRDWVDLWISPYEDHLALPLDEDADLAGAPRQAVQIRQGMGHRTFFQARVFRDFKGTELPFQDEGLETVVEPSAVQREPFELRISRTRIRFGMPNRNLWWVDSTIADLGWTRGVVQFGHHVYSPDKGCVTYNAATRKYDDGLEPCTNTWHWDNVQIEPAVPFTMLRADRRYVDATTPPSVTFPSAAPDGAHLRFGGVGRVIEVSFDGGASWQVAQKQAQRGIHGANAFGSYWTPVPAGTTQVHFRGQNSVHDWMARDISIFARGEPPAQ